MSCKREIAEVTLKHGGSITACHGATRAGDAELVPTEMGSAWEVVKGIKRALDPNNIMNPGKQSLDEAYPTRTEAAHEHLPPRRPAPARAAAHHRHRRRCGSSTSTRSTRG